jgi:hypothetical protein
MDQPNSAAGVEQSKMTIKAMAAYNTDLLTLGVEYAMQNQKGQSLVAGGGDAKVNAISIFARGAIMPKQFMWFARYDMYDPNTNATDNLAGRKENFITAGLDWQPDPTANAHIMPNIWVNTFKDKSSANLDYESIVVGRLTLAYKF